MSRVHACRREGHAPSAGGTLTARSNLAHPPGTLPYPPTVCPVACPRPRPNLACQTRDFIAFSNAASILVVAYSLLTFIL